MSTSVGAVVWGRGRKVVSEASVGLTAMWVNLPPVGGAALGAAAWCHATPGGEPPHYPATLRSLGPEQLPPMIARGGKAEDMRGCGRV